MANVFNQSGFQQGYSEASLLFATDNLYAGSGLQSAADVAGLVFDVAAGAGSGLVTGGKAIFNSAADTVSNFVTLGFYDSPIRFTPTQTDIANGFGAASVSSRAGLEIAAGILTGGASKLGNIGKGIFALDLGGNILSAERAAVNISNNGASFENTLQLVGGVAGVAGNLPEISNFRFDTSTLSSGGLGGVHRNSLSLAEETHVYRIVGPDGSTYKIGESAQGTRVRDGASLRAEEQVRELNRTIGPGFSSEIIQNFSNKRSARDYETDLIERFRSFFGDDTLPGNKTNR